MSATDEQAEQVVAGEVDKHSLNPDEVQALHVMAGKLSGMTDLEKQEFLRQLTPRQLLAKKPKNEIEVEQTQRARQVSIPAPKNDDELHALIIKLTGYNIPRVAVCADHRAPFDWIADAYFNRHRAILVLGSREFGKCAASDTEVYDARTGLTRSIQEIVDGGETTQTFTMTPSGEIQVAPISSKIVSGRRECIRLRTMSGRDLTVTPEHPLMGPDGWVRADEVGVGGSLAMPAHIPEPLEPQRIEDAHVDLLAILLSEGCIKFDTVSFSSGDPEIVRIATEAAAEMCCDTKAAGEYGYRFTKGDGLRDNFVRAMLDDYGIGHEGAREKFLPEAIFRLPDDQLIRFLSIFWMCDGYVGKLLPEIGLASELMVRQIQRLLLRIGVQSRVRYKSAKNGEKTFDVWSLHIYGSSIPNFGRLNLWSYKRDQLEALLAKKRNPCVGRPPVTAKFMNEFRAAVPKARRGSTQAEERRQIIREELGWRSDGKWMGTTSVLTSGTSSLQARRLRALCKAVGIDESQWSLLLSDELWWDVVVEVEEVGEKEVFDLSMIPTESFIANDIVVHNSLGGAILQYVNAETKPGCVAADTLIDCPRDHRLYPEGIPISQIKAGQLVWTFDEYNRVFELKPVIQVFMSRSDVPIYKLTIDDGHVIRATEDHRFLRRDGSWAELRDLQVGDSLMPMYRDYEPYVRVRPDATRGGGRVVEFKAVADVLWPERKGLHVDHIDEQRSNSSQYNLQLMTGAEHCSKTMKGRSVGFRRRQDLHDWWESLTEEEKTERSRKISIGMANGRIPVISEEGREVWRECGRQVGNLPKVPRQYVCSVCGGEFSRTPARGAPLCSDCKTEVRVCPVCSEDYVVERSNRRATCSRSCGQKMNWMKRSGTWNHSILSIEPDGHEDVWDMEVEDNHNFVVHGVVLHNCEGVIFAAIQAQAKQVYRYIRAFVFDRDEEGNRRPKQQILGEPTRDFVEWRSGSSLRSLVGTMSGVNSPHPNVVHADELDLMDQEVFQESRAMASSSVVDGQRIPALDIVTSTRKSMKGPMQQLLDEVEEAQRNGFKPAWEVYASCFREVAQEVPCCRRSDPVERVHRLIALGRDPRELCRCHEVVKGEWGFITNEDGSETPVPRTLDSVCRGDLFRSRGWYAYEDIVGKFEQMSKLKWEAQMECRRPMSDGLYLQGFARERHCIRRWAPRPEYGKLWEGVDWGGAAPSVVLWLQGPTLHPIQIQGYDGNPAIVPQGSVVIYDELVAPPIGATKLADLVSIREANWRRQFPGWRVKGRFADMAGRQQREDWHAHSPPLRTHWYISRDFDPTVDAIQDSVNDSLLYVDVAACPSLCDDFEAWHQKNGREVHDESSHGPAAARYAITNIKAINRDLQRHRRNAVVLPIVRERGLEQSPHLPAVSDNAISSPSNGIESEKWRQSYGPAASAEPPGENGWRVGI